jgi:hypothetical protein
MREPGAPRGEGPLLLVRPREALSGSRERGAIAPLLAVLVSTLILFSLWGANQVSLVGVRREQQKAADLGGLAGAANVPMVGLFASGEPQATACEYVEKLLARDSSPLANNLTETRTGPTCAARTVEVEPLIEFPGLAWFLGRLDGLAGDEQAQVRGALDDLWSAADAEIEKARAALADAIDELERTLGVTLDDPDLSSDLCNPVNLAAIRAIDPFFTTLTDTDCASLRDALAGLPGNLSPAAVTPAVRVRVANRVRPPVPLPEFLNGASADGAWSITATAAARRRFKNLIVLPAVAPSDLCGSSPEPSLEVPAPSPPALPEPSPLPQPSCEPVDPCPPLDAESPVCGVPQPLDTPINVNPTLADVRDVLIPALWEANEAVGDAVAPYLPPGESLYARVKADPTLGPYVPGEAEGTLPPEDAFDLGQLIRDAQDLYDPPPGGAAPRPVDVAAEAARTGEPVVILRLFRMPVLGVPAFDVTAAYLDLSACESTPDLTVPCFRATPIPVEQLAAATGLFGATLIA